MTTAKDRPEVHQGQRPSNLRIFALPTRAASRSYLDLKMSEVSRFEHTAHPIEFEMYYSA